LHSRTSCWAKSTFVSEVRTSFIHQYGDVGHVLLPSIEVIGPEVSKAATYSGATSATDRGQKKGGWLTGQKLRTVPEGRRHQGGIVTAKGLQ
jgi:hypothetical protein